MKRFVPYIIYIYIIACYRILLSDALSIGSAQIYITPLIVMLVALHKDYLTSLWFGFAAGIVYDAIDPSHFGVQMTILSILGILTSQAKERFNLESLLSLIVLLGGGLFIYSIPHTLIYATSGVSEFWGVFFKTAIPGVIYTVGVGWLFFMIKSGRISYQSIKELF